MDTPLVSVIIPAHNAELFICEAIDSVLTQTYSNIELIVVLDSCADSTKTCLAKYTNKIQIVESNNKSIALSRNDGISIAVGKYIAFLDADDIFKSSKLEIQVQLLEDNLELIGCSTNFSEYKNNRILKKSLQEDYYSNFSRNLYALEKLSIEKHGINLYQGNLYKLMLQGNLIHPPTVLFRNIQLNTLNKKYRSAADYQFLLYLCTLGDWAIINKPLLLYRVHENQDSGDTNDIKNVESIILLLEDIVNSNFHLDKNDLKLLGIKINRLKLKKASLLANSNKQAAIKSLTNISIKGLLNLKTIYVMVKIILPYRAKIILTAFKKHMWKSK